MTDMDEKETKYLEEIMGTPWIFIVQLLLLAAKHQDTCVFMPIDINEITIKLPYTFYSYFSLTWNGDINTLSAPDMLDLKKFIDLLRDCSNNYEKRYVVIPLNLAKTLKTRSGHSNILIYDKETHSIERYEPNGKTTPTGFNTVEMDEKIMKLFSYIFKKDDKQITYYKPESFCPIKGPQYIEHMSRKELLFTIKRGTCSLWSIAYTDARLSYPDLTRHEIHDKMLRDITKSDKKMYYFILDYLKNIYKVSQLLRESNSTDQIIQYLLENIK